MAILSSAQKRKYQEDGVIVVPSAISGALLDRLRVDFAGWVNESRSHDGPFGAMQDGRPRFDVEPGHSASKPGLRRVGS
ncbi:MAG: hypothetical protein ACI861_001238, partial [Paracoccaceae bacterium]